MTTVAVKINPELELLRKCPLPISPDKEYEELYKKIPNAIGLMQSLQVKGVLLFNNEKSWFEITDKGKEYLALLENPPVPKITTFSEIPREIRRLTDNMNNGHTEESLKNLYNSLSEYYNDLFSPGNSTSKKLKDFEGAGNLWAAIDVDSLTIIQTGDAETYEFMVFGKPIRLETKTKDIESCEKFRFYILKEFNARLPRIPKEFWEILLHYWRLKNLDHIRQIEDMDDEHKENMLINYITSCNVIPIETGEKPAEFAKAFNDRYLLWDKSAGIIKICSDHLLKLLNREKATTSLRDIGRLLKKYKVGEERPQCDGQRKVFWWLSIEKLGWLEADLQRKVLEDESSD